MQKPSPNKKEETVNKPDPKAIPKDWKTYTNSKLGFSLQYPPYLTVGKTAPNSVLGTYDEPVTGIYLGGVVLVPLASASLKQKGIEYFKGSYDTADQPAKTPSGEMPAVMCKKLEVPSTKASIQAVSCSGEGGVGFYALITEGTNTMFVDGYSKGFDDNGLTTFKSEADKLQSLSTFSFSH
jgi:hypothetical protein